MTIPTIQGVIKRRMLINFRVDPEVMQRNLPSRFRPKLHRGSAIAGICLIRLEKIRPVGLPEFLGLSSENAAHRVAVLWEEHDGQHEGVFIPRRDTESCLSHAGGGRLFPGEHNLARFDVQDDGKLVDFQMRSLDQTVSVRVIGSDADALPATSSFASLEDASRFFECGSIGYSATSNPCRLDGIQLETEFWRVRSLSLKGVHSSFFSDAMRFPRGSVEFDHALIMREVPHRWHGLRSMTLTA